MLNTTYRLNAELCEVIGRVFYAGALCPSAAARDRRIVVDLAPYAPSATAVARALSPEVSFVWVRSGPGGSHQANTAEAAFVAETVRTCLLAGVSPDAVAVVTPFRRQAALIRDRLQAQLPAGARLPIIDTVERVQGLTVEIVVVSLCASEPEYAASVLPFLCSPNRLNVAISRARTTVVLVASSTLANLSASDAAGQRQLAYWRQLVEMALPTALLCPPEPAVR